MKNIFRKILTKCHIIAPLPSFRERCWRKDAWMIDEYQLPELTTEEVALFKKTWPCFPSVDKRDLTPLRMYKHLFAFDPYYLPDFPYFEYLIKRTNPAEMAKPFENKAMYDVYLPQLPIATTITKSVYGVKYDGENTQISADEEVAMLSKQNQFVIKPSRGTGGGKGVQKVCLDEVDDKENFVRQLVNVYGADYVAQEVIEQHPTLHVLNPTCLNTCRVTTMNFNGKISSVTTLKVGKQNADKDNWFTSYFIGVSSDGVVRDYGYDAKLKRVTQTDNGEKFGGIHMPEYDKMVTAVEHFHQLYFPMFGVLGWDVVVDKDSNVRVIEVNVDYPGIAGQQFASGPFLRSRHDDIINLLQGL